MASLGKPFYPAASAKTVDNVNSALRLARAGLHVFPCDWKPKPAEPGVPSKMPLVKWRDLSTTDESAVCRWWRQWPLALIGIDLGKSDLIVIDPDRHGGPDGVAAFEELTAKHGLPDGVPVVETLRDGAHHYFKQPIEAKLGNSPGRLPDGIDVRGVGGFTIAPGSIVGGGRGWKMAPGSSELGDAVTAGAIPVLPAWLLDLIRPQEPRPATPAAPSIVPAHQVEEKRERARAEKALVENCAELASMTQSGRNNKMNAIAYRMGRFVAAGWVEQGRVESALMATCWQNGLAQEDGETACRKSIASGLSKGLTNPIEPIPPKEAPAIFHDPKPRQKIEVGGIVADAETGEVLGDFLQPAGHHQTLEKQGLEGEFHHSTGQPLPPLKIINPADYYGQVIAPRRWIVRDWIPYGVVTGLYGDGGLGKSLLAQQLQSACACGGEWIGQDAQRVKSIGFYCEDDADELLRRQENITDAMTLNPAELANIQFVSRVNQDNILMTFSKNGKGELTPLHKQIVERSKDFGARLAVLDTAADFFAGNENDRGQVRQFVAVALGSIAEAIDGAVLLCAHPSRSGMSSGTGDGGSTGWSNSFRSRLYLSMPEGDAVPSDDERVLARKKANYAARNDQVQLIWNKGVFRVNKPNGSSSFRAGAGCLDSAPRKLGGFLPGCAERGA